MEIWPDYAVVYSSVFTGVYVWRLLLKEGMLHLSPTDLRLPASESALESALRDMAVIEIMAS